MHVGRQRGVAAQLPRGQGRPAAAGPAAGAAHTGRHREAQGAALLLCLQPDTRPILTINHLARQQCRLGRSHISQRL